MSEPMYPIREPRSSSGSAAALLLAGVILAGRAVATVVEGRGPADLAGVTPAPTSLPASSAVVVPAGSDTTVDVVKELLPAVVTVVNRAQNGQAQSSGSGFVIDAGQGFVVTNNHVFENARGKGLGASFAV